MVGRDCGNRTRAGFRYVAPYAASPRRGRVSGLSVLFQNPGTAFTGTLSRDRQRRDHRWHETRSGGGDTRGWVVDGKLRMATGVCRNWPSKFSLVTSVDKVDAAC